MLLSFLNKKAPVLNTLTHIVWEFEHWGATKNFFLLIFYVIDLSKIRHFSIRTNFWRRWNNFQNNFCSVSSLQIKTLKTFAVKKFVKFCSSICGHRLIVKHLHFTTVVSIEKYHVGIFN